MVKPIWKGDISFGLVSIPVSLIPVEDKNELKFHLLDAKTQSRVRYQRVNEETGEEVPWENIVKGWEYEKDSYVIINELAFEKASSELFKSICIDEFVNLDEIDNLYYSKPYFLQPESKNKKAYVLLREALKKSKKVGVAKTVLRTKESLSLIIPHDHALLLYLIHFADDIREEQEAQVPLEDLKAYNITDKEIKMAEALIKEMTTSWQPQKYHNEYRETMQKWLEQQALKLKKMEKKLKAKRGNEDAPAIVDFIGLLKDSMKKKLSPKALKSKKSNVKK